MSERVNAPETPLGRALRRIAKGTRLSSLDCPVLDDAADEIDDLQRQLTEAQAALLEAEKQNRIITLSGPAEEDLQYRIDDLLKEIAMTEGGWRLTAAARLLVECQRRMAVDWVEIGNVRRESKAALSAATQEREQLKDLARHTVRHWVFDSTAGAVDALNGHFGTPETCPHFKCQMVRPAALASPASTEPKP